MDYLPFNLKISYHERLDIQLFIRHQLNNQKFKRHWVFCKGYNENQEQKIFKNYIGFLSQGDIYRIKTSNLSSNWKQKTLQEVVNTNQHFLSNKTKKNYKLSCKDEFLFIEKQVRKQQYDQFFVITIFLSQKLSYQQFQEFKNTLLDLQNPQFLVNIFAPQQYIQKLTSQKPWIRIYSAVQIKQEMRGLFGSMNKINFKKVYVKLKCLDGDITISQNGNINDKSNWESDGDHICNVIYFPSCNSPYIMSVEMKNLLKNQICRFQIELVCEDQTGNQNKSIKTFSLKPRRQFIDWTDTNSPTLNGLRLSKYQQLSLSFEQVNLNQKLNFMKIYGTPGKILLKNKIQV